MGLADPIGQCDYQKYIEPFRQLDVTIYRLEDLVKIEGYPADRRGKSKIPIDDKFRENVEERVYPVIRVMVGDEIHVCKPEVTESPEEEL